MNKLLALDGDGVIFDYRKAFPGVWKRAFGTTIEMVEPNAYHATTAYGIQWESKEQEAEFFKHFDEDAWSTMELMPGADEACDKLVKAGFELVIVSSMNHRFGEARLKNCELHSLPIKTVHAVKRVGDENPKLEILHKLKPLALVDDLVDNFEGLDPSIYRAFINYERIDCPSKGRAIPFDTWHYCLLGFADYWIKF